MVEFTASVIKMTDDLPKSYGAVHLGQQLIRSATSPALNYAEAQGSESRKDFIHKMKVCLKELRESHSNMKIIAKLNYLRNHSLEELMDENNQLISIFVKSIRTAEQNR